MTAGARPTAEVSGGFLLEPVTDLDALREEWSGLAAASGNIFATWEWASIWWRHFGRDRPLVASACRAADGRLIAILPLYLFSQRLGIVRFVGHDAGDQLGPICAPADTAEVGRALARALRDASFPWRLFVGDWMPGNERWASQLGGRVVRTEGSPIVPLDSENWEELSGRWSRQLRKAARRRERNLRSEHDVTLRLADEPDRLRSDLDSLFALHAARWTDKSGFSSREAFHRDFARCALERGWLRLWLLEVDGRAIGALYGFRFAGVESCYQGGWDDTWARFGPGVLMFIHAIRTAFEDGALEYRFLRGGEDYKYSFARQDDGVETIAVPRGLGGKAVLTAALAARRLRIA